MPESRTIEDRISELQDKLLDAQTEAEIETIQKKLKVLESHRK